MVWKRSGEMALLSRVSERELSAIRSVFGFGSDLLKPLNFNELETRMGSCLEEFLKGASDVYARRSVATTGPPGFIA